jgi:hypothetical protein
MQGGECVECTLTGHLNVAAQVPQHIVTWNALKKNNWYIEREKNSKE